MAKPGDMLELDRPTLAENRNNLESRPRVGA